MEREMHGFEICPIGYVRAREGRYGVALLPEYAPALAGLDGFGHLQLLWWANGCSDAEARAARVLDRPYRSGPKALGVFATRSPARPNPLCVTVAGLRQADPGTGLVWVDWLDAVDGTPVLDLKPYTPSADRIEAPVVPAWCAHWPPSVERSAAYNWEEEFS